MGLFDTSSISDRIHCDDAWLQSCCDGPANVKDYLNAYVDGMSGWEKSLFEDAFSDFKACLKDLGQTV